MIRDDIIYKVNKYIDKVSKHRKMYNVIDTLESIGYFNAPASTKYHGAHVGGLVEHSLYVTELLEKFTVDNHLSWLDETSPIVVGLFHDLCKCDSYNIVGSYYNEYGQKKDKIEWNDNQSLFGHGDKSVMLASTLLKLTIEEVVCIRYHMYMFEKNIDPNIIGNVVKKVPNILWTHVADMLATYTMEDE